MDDLGRGLVLLVSREPIPPPLGLALEDYHARLGRPTLLVWRHHRSVIVGRSTSLQAEVDCEAAQALGVPVYRRRSGGGAVYHDPGNLNLTLVVPGRVYPDRLYELGTSILVGILGLLGLEAWVENEADIVVDGWKVSGGASRIGRRSSMYHATLLVEADTSLLHRVVKPRLDLVRSGRVTPAKYRPRNLASITPHIRVPRVLGAIRELAISMGWPSDCADPASAAGALSYYRREC